jgi:hypothetical protein
MLLEVRVKCLAVVAHDHCKVSNVRFLVSEEQSFSFCVAQGRGIRAENLSPTLVSRVEALQANAQNGRLHFIESTIEPLGRYLVAPNPSVLAYAPEPLGNIGVIADNGPCVSKGREILRRIEAEAANCSERANALAG